MKVTLKLDVTDDHRRRIKVALGYKGGMASRHDVRGWVLRQVDLLPFAPGPKARTVKAEVVKAAPKGPKCRHCGNVKCQGHESLPEEKNARRFEPATEE